MLTLPSLPSLRRAALLCGTWALLLVAPAHAHLPHDNAKSVVVSPDYAVDRTIFALVQLTTHPQLERSRDAGQSWEVLGAPFLNDNVRELIVSPAFADDATLFAVTDEAGLWRSTDAGDHWQPWGLGGADLTVRALHCVAASPDFAADGTLLVGSTSGLFRSTDGGASFAQVSVGLVESSFEQVRFADDDADTVFCAGQSVHRSDDGGQTWVPLGGFGLLIATLAVSPGFSRDGVVAVGFGRFGGGVMLSTDGGLGWASADTGLLEPTVNDLEFAADGRAFAVTTQHGCYRAPSPGGTWVLHDAGFEALSDQTFNHFTGLALSPDYTIDGEVLVAAFEGLHHSFDGGDTWVQHDIHNQRFNINIALTPDGGELYAANYGGGVLRLKLGGGAQGGFPAAGSVSGTTLLDTAALATWGPAGGQPVAPLDLPHQGWTSRSQDLNDLYAGELAVSPDYAADRTLFYGLLGLRRSTDGGRHWQALPVPGQFPRTLCVSADFARDRTLIYGTYDHGTWISQDAGDSWSAADGGLPALIKTSAIVLAPDFVNDGRAWMSSVTHGLWRSDDHAASWQPLAAPLGTDVVRCVAVSPQVASDGLVLAGTGGRGLWRSLDGGDSWAPANTGLPAGGQGSIEDIAFSPNFAGDGVVFVASNGDGVQRSDDGGLTWAPANTGLPASAPRALQVSADFAQDATLFVSTYDWIWRSIDGGSSWARLPGFLHVDERHPTVALSGAWSDAGFPGSHGAAVKVSDQAGAAMEFRFQGRSVACHFARDAGSGLVDIELDGRLVERLDLYSPAPLSPTAVWARSFGAPGWHSVRIVVTGLSGGESAGANVRCDGFRYTF